VAPLSVMKNKDRVVPQSRFPQHLLETPDILVEIDDHMPKKLARFRGRSLNICR
jgi:hypothetical protein